MVIVLSGHVSGEVVRHSEIFPALRSRGLSVQRTVEVLTDIGVFQDDRTPSFEQWLERKLEGIAPGILLVKSQCSCLALIRSRQPGGT
ncbi:hypothetical protein [Streptomyces sp. NPDC058632]|uniref:hypothetical protein n=1 Tax=Streptomyces sp. NPDC058632 TaxID=3346567 RepID=UPI00364AD715